ncbi:hypothetical protein JCM3770_000076, partial [Rhodotorula araucariae]
MAQAVQPVSASEPVFVRALYSYTGADSSSLSFRQGDILEVLSVLDSGWWDGIVLQTGTRGWFPSNYTEPIGEDEAMWETGGHAAHSRRGSLPSGTSRTASQDDGAFEAGLVQSFGAQNLDEPPLRDPTLQDFINGGEFDLTPFSTGGDIFGEIAAAAAQSDSAGTSAPPMSPEQSATSYASSTAAASAQPGDAVEDEDFWVPKMTHAGQLFYYNTRTGETSRDMPIDGQGDGIRVDPGEYSLDARESAARRASLFADGAVRRPSVLSTGPGGDGGEWSERTTEDGRSSYFVNLRTGEQTWEPPSSIGAGTSRRGSTRQRAPAGDVASLLSGWTERPARSQPVKVAEADEQDLASATSDDSPLDATFAQPATQERGAAEHAEELAAPA